RKIGELERQIAQLKAELDRARAAESAPRGGREREFLNLREQLTTRDRELGQLKTDLATKLRELDELRGSLKAEGDTRTTLEAKLLELEHRLGVVPQLEQRERAIAQQLATLQHELAAKVQELASTEGSRAQLERDLGGERALRAANASEAEH